MLWRGLEQAPDKLAASDKGAFGGEPRFMDKFHLYEIAEAVAV